MCHYKFTHHSCGHTLLRAEEPYDPSCKLCLPVLVALNYYHDQPNHVCVENTFQQAPMRMPKPCPRIGPYPADDMRDTQIQDRSAFNQIMERLGVNKAEQEAVEQLAARRDNTSKRPSTVSLTPVSPHRVHYLKELERWQVRPYQPSNITYDIVAWGCGGTGPGLTSGCLSGWTGLGILMYRHGVWNRDPPRPWDSCNPTSPVGWLYVDYGDTPILKLPERWRASAVRTLIDIPMYGCLYAVLSGRPSGPLVYSEQGYLVPALGASGPEVPVAPHLSIPQPPIQALQPLPQLVIQSAQTMPRRQIASTHRGVLRPPQVPVSQAHSDLIFAQQETNTSIPGGPHSQRINRIWEEAHASKTPEAGPSQQVDRAGIGKVKRLSQRRASRSDNNTPTIGTSRGSDPLSSALPTPGCTRPSSPASNVPKSEKASVGLGIIKKSPPTTPADARRNDCEDTVLDQPLHHCPSHQHEAAAELSISEGKKPTPRPSTSRKHSVSSIKESPGFLYPNTKLSSPPGEPIFDMLSNLNIGAEHAGTLPQRPTTHLPTAPTQSPHVSALLSVFTPPSTASTTQAPHLGATPTTQPHRPINILQNIAQATSNMAAYAAQLTATQQAPGGNYALNPTAVTFEPISIQEVRDKSASPPSEGKRD